LVAVKRAMSERHASEREQGTWNQLVTLHAQVSELVERALQDRFGLSLTEYSALEALAEAPGPAGLRMQALAEAIGLNQSSVSRLVARLERQGLAERSLNERDRRGVFTSITETGRETLKEATPVYLQTLAAAFDRVGADPVLRELIERIIQ
jgi:DNA-binding MarR family transcriptional regulator